ncbi:MAG: metalloregulator ArsR/SmtB family transcription factor [Actinomycetia bacterium]|nr:metalloregulator ArsR/SmtB family transcription factor [Actinomycetes bacterium]
MSVTQVRPLTAEQVGAAFKALASEQRRSILRMLATCPLEPGAPCGTTGEVCACKISERLNLAPSTVSHHMGMLRAAGLVSARKEGTWVHYRLKRDVIEQVASELLGF